MDRLARLLLSRPAAALGALAVGSLALASPAHAWWRGGVFVGIAPPPLYFGPPVFFSPPIVYAPPPVVYAPPGSGYAGPGAFPPPPAGFGQSCFAGAYMCPLPQSFPFGATCSCPDNFGRRVFGQAR